MMRVFIKTLKNDKFEIYVKPEDKVSDVKKIIETTQYAYINYPAHEQKLIHHGNVLTDETTFKENNITEDDSSIVIMHSKGCDGISIIELFYMVYISRHVVEPEKQIGTISMKVDDCIQYNLYAEHKIDISKPSIEYMDHIPLVGSGPIGPFYSGLELEFDDLFCSAYNGSIEITPKTFGRSDGLLRESIQSRNRNGEISALFGYFTNATIATLEVQLLNMSASAPINVHGVIASTNNHFDSSSGTSIHFHRKPTNMIEVYNTQEEHVGVIPLSKYCVGVPLGSVMYVDISLFCDDKYHQDTACFDALIDGTDSQEIAGRFLVKVTWNCNKILSSSDDDYDSSYE